MGISLKIYIVKYQHTCWPIGADAYELRVLSVPFILIGVNKPKQRGE